MRLLPSGSRAVLVELDSLDEVMGFYAGLVEHRPEGVVDIVPASRSILVVLDPGASPHEVIRALSGVRPRLAARSACPVVRVPVRYDGEDLSDVAKVLGISVGSLIKRHTEADWRVAFCGFAPGFGYLTSGLRLDVPRRGSPRTKVPEGAVALAGNFSAVYPRQSPGGWQLIGRTALTMFRLDREPPALLSPGTRVEFVDVDR